MEDENRIKALYQKAGKIFGRVILAISLLKVEVNGLENIPRDTNVIYTPNHQSYLDIIILLKYLPYPFKFIIMRKLFKVPLVGDHITRSGFLSLDRKDRKNSIKTIKAVVDLLQRNRSFVIFPEGKLTSDGTIGEFGRGTAIIIQRSRKPVIPIYIDGTFDVLPKGAWIVRHKDIKVNIGKPVYFDEYYCDLDKSSSYELSRKLRDIVISLKDQ
jgi:1-acyl-sn-glycerol-3-phosphate acyltransferase